MKTGSQSKYEWQIKFGNKWSKDWKTIEVYAYLAFGYSAQYYEISDFSSGIYHFMAT